MHTYNIIYITYNIIYILYIYDIVCVHTWIYIVCIYVYIYCMCVYYLHGVSMDWRRCHVDERAAKVRVPVGINRSPADDV